MAAKKLNLPWKPSESGREWGEIHISSKLGRGSSKGSLGGESIAGHTCGAQSKAGESGECRTPGAGMQGRGGRGDGEWKVASI